MGASFEYKHFPKTQPKELKEQYNTYFLQLEAEYGHNRYSGQLSALPCDIAFTRQSFDNTQTAIDWIVENHKKWEAPLAVQVPDGWIIGGWCPS